MSRGDHEGWRVPVLDRVRADVERVAERDAAALRRGGRRQRPRRVAAVVAVCLALLGLAGVLGSRGEESAVADIRDAPRAAEQRGNFAFRTQLVAVTSGGAIVRTGQAGVVDLRASAFAARTLVRGRRGAERRGVGGTLYFRSVDAPGPWRRAGGGGLPASVVPVSASGLRALAEARDETLVNRGESVGDVPVTHLRLRMRATTFLRLQQGSPEGRRLRAISGVVDVWLDADDLPRRVAARFHVGERAFTVDTRYSDYGESGPVAGPARASAAMEGAALAVADPAVTSMIAVFSR